jgi:hypothetical protein
MLNLLKSKKAQFYIISVVSIITILSTIGRSITTHSIIDTSELALRNDFFVFNNIIEKTLETLNASKSCEELEFNLEEFKNIATRAFAPDFRVEYSYSIDSCDDTTQSATVSFNITLYSINSEIGTTFTKNINW